jgi:NADPH-dependent curcumin reductase CurA
MCAGAIAEVVESRAAYLPVGALVFASTNWSEYAVLNKGDCMPIKPVPGLSVTHFTGSLDLPGLTAYYGLKEFTKVKPEELVVVSGAAGAVGNMAVQIAKKLLGCKHIKP